RNGPGSAAQHFVLRRVRGTASLSAAALDRFLLPLENILVLRLEALPGAALAADIDHRLVLAAVADDRHGLLAAFDPLHLLEQHLAVQDDALVARGQMLLRPIGDRALPDPT